MLSDWPLNVGRITALVDVAGRTVSTSSWWHEPSGVPMDSATCEVLADQWLLNCAVHLSQLMTSNARIAACRVECHSTVFARALVQVDPIPGEWTGAQALNVVVGLHFSGFMAGKGRASVMWLPGCPDEFITDSQALSGIGYANLRDHGVEYLNAFNALSIGSGRTIVHGTLHQISGGVRISPAVFDQTISVRPSDRVLTMRRRLPSGRQVRSA